MSISEYPTPADWSAVDAEIATSGAVVLKSFVHSELLGRLNNECDRYIESSYQKAGGQTDSLPGLPDTKSTTYNRFLGHKTIRLHGLIEKLPCSSQVIGNADLLGWAKRALAPVASQVRLSAAELIQIQPGEPRQAAHRDSDSWPLPLGADPFVVNAIVALSDFTQINGATWVGPGSFRDVQTYSSVDFVQATMAAGDALLFRGDLVHGAGANEGNTPRRAVSVSFCAGWLRGVENSVLNLSLETVRGLTPELQAVLGFAAYDGSARGNGLLGLYENGDPAVALDPNAKPV